MNTLTKSLAAIALLTGSLLPVFPAQAQPAIALSTPAPAKTALTALLASPDSPLPSGTKLLSIHVSAGLATINFSRELRDNFAGGDSAETRAVNAVLRTLGQFPTVSRVQMLVEGQPIDSLGGLLVLTEPLPVIRPVSANETSQPRWLHRKPASTGDRSRNAQKRYMPAADAR